MLKLLPFCLLGSLLGIAAAVVYTLWKGVDQ